MCIDLCVPQASGFLCRDFLVQNWGKKFKMNLGLLTYTKENIVVVERKGFQT